MEFKDKLKLFLQNFVAENKGVFISFFLILILVLFAKFNTVSAVSISNPEYTELSYLSINTTSFTTDYKPNNNSRFVLDADLGGFVSWTNILGDGSTVYIQTNLGDGDNVAYTYTWNSVFVGRSYRGLAGRHVIDINKGILTVDNNVVGTSTNTGTFSSSRFFGLNNNSGMFRISKYNVHSLQIFEDDVLVRHYIPAKENSSGNLGFLDIVNNNFTVVSNSGAGDVVVSPELKLNVSTTSETTGFVKIYTQAFPEDFRDNYSCSVSSSYGEDGKRVFYPASVDVNGSYFINAYGNGTYVFKLEDREGNVYSASVTITNIITSSSSGINFYPVLNVRPSGLNSVDVFTQSLTLTELANVECYYWVSSERWKF